MLSFESKDVMVLSVYYYTCIIKLCDVSARQ